MDRLFIKYNLWVLPHKLYEGIVSNTYLDDQFSNFYLHLSVSVDEFNEFVEEPSVAELFDVLHGILRLSRIDLLGLLAWPTARKHALRVIEYGCPRSKRNHNEKGENCVCKKN